MAEHRQTPRGEALWSVHGPFFHMSKSRQVFGPATTETVADGFDPVKGEGGDEKGKFLVFSVQLSGERRW